MALLTLKDIGKIYVSEGNVAVGIRGVNLSFDRGEFVAVTGKSGSGKSTLLNVISGMDSYEEGELFIEGEATSHYLQPDWEQYREKYISFIFQDYNIIESFTVLQNVELALLHIENPRERHARALELIRRVGLAGHIRQKGSKLSGGQKQRTVIARALAKDSPIILADEPTGNLDYATSKEIIELLREVSRDKLLIVVTHNFDQVEDCATRHIRIFDGAVETDHTIRREEPATPAPQAPKKPAHRSKRRDFKNGLALGGTIFAAKPKLSFFLALLMIVGMLGIFAVTTLCGTAMDMFDKSYMFSHIDGRVVLAHRDGSPLTDAELAALKEEYGAQSLLHYDALLDDTYRFSAHLGDYHYITFVYTYGEHYGEDIVGRYPTAPDEVLLYLPIYLQPIVGKDTLLIDTVELMGSFDVRVVGVKYFYNNNLNARCLFTDEGFRYATAQCYLQDSSTSFTAEYKDTTGATHHMDLYSFRLSTDLAPGTIALAEESFLSALSNGKVESLSVQFHAQYYRYDYYQDSSEKHLTFSKSFTLEDVDVAAVPDVSEGKLLLMSPDVLTAIAEATLADSYKQASLFFRNDTEARNASEALQEAGYIAVPSYTEYSPEPGETVLNMVASIFLALIWLLAIVFLAFFINLCSGRALSAFKGDMAIMRSMGIPVRVIRVGMYTRMLLALLPACVLLAVLAVAIFTSPVLNEYFVYLYLWQYAAIYAGMLLLTVRITYTQVKRLFGESVKKSLKGGGVA